MIIITMVRDKRNDASNRNRVTRRTVLKAVGAGAAVGVGVGTTGSATAQSTELTSEQQELKSSYRDAQTVRAAFHDTADELLDTLAERGFLDHGVAGELPLDNFQMPAEYADADGVHVTALRENGVDTAHIVVSMEAEHHEVEIVVQPELDRAYARTIPNDGDSTLVASTDDVTPDKFCWDESECRAECCVVDGDCRATNYERECCDYAGSINCQTWGPSGCC